MKLFWYSNGGQISHYIHQNLSDISPRVNASVYHGGPPDNRGSRITTNGRLTMGDTRHVWGQRG